MKKNQFNWGHWHLKKSTAVLQLWLPDDVKDLEHNMYEIDLEQCRTNAQVLDWIQHIQGRFCRDYPLCLSDFVRALNEILHLPANYCSFGCDKGGLSATEIKKRVKGCYHPAGLIQGSEENLW